MPVPALALDVVVGTGTPASCTEAALDAAVTQIVPLGGTIRFNCGASTTNIPITRQKVFYFPSNPNLVYGIDGGPTPAGSRINLVGNGATRLILHLSGSLVLANLTLVDGTATGTGDERGGAIRSDRDPDQVQAPMGLTLNRVVFFHNRTISNSAPPNPSEVGGGAVFTRRAYLVVSNCTFLANNTYFFGAGGAIHGRSSSISISDTTFQLNTAAGFGGAIHLDGMSPMVPSGAVQISTTTFSSNQAVHAGGAISFLAQDGESLTIDAAQFTSNEAFDDGTLPAIGARGGALAGTYGSVAIANTTFNRNMARGDASVNGGGSGGAIALSHSAAVAIVNSTISENRATGSAAGSFGGGVFISDHTQPFQILHSTIWGNTAGTSGGGVSGANGALVHSIVSNNTQPQCSDSVGHSGSIQFPDSSPRCASGILVADPLLTSLGPYGGLSGTHHPLPGSPTIDAVPCLLTRDQRGVLRPLGERCDVGSVEYYCPISINPGTAPTGRTGVPYTQAFAASGALSAVTFGVAGVLPAGLTFDANGTLSGTPSQSGAFLIEVTATGPAVPVPSTCTSRRTYNLVIADAVSMTPAALAVDPGGNGVLEPNETVTLDPTWTNTTGAGVNLTGALSSFVGPVTGSAYDIADGQADYGPLANGASARCLTTGDCYAVRVTSTYRPEQHWDTSVVETVTTGGPQAWTLHVGLSFVDVPASSPFYRFIETLLHRQVTVGCHGPSSIYCPSIPTTRETMAVFVLASKEGAGYQPPACGGTPLFNDVPIPNQYCPWIEELARRGVVSGCGGGNYCPGNVVTREQMAVFVLLTLDSSLDPPACTTPVFADMPASNPFCRWVEELARRGVVSGCAPGRYCPTSAVTREQMAVFLTVTFGLTLYGP